jgi:protoheme IX farnesyltransferase
VARRSVRSTLRAYYWLTKPGIIYGNCLSAAAGFLLAAQRDVDWLVFAAAIGGTALVIAAGCVLNNYMDREIDKKMDRTKRRALVSGTISHRSALIYAAILSLAGFTVLTLFTNTLTVYVGLLGLYFYVIVYGIWKRRSPIGTIVGSISGSASILAGYTAATNQLDVGAGLLFLAMALWQMPHFYAIALYRLDDYRAAGLPVLPAVKGIRHTKIQIMIYIVLYTIATTMLTVFGYTGYVFLGAMVLLGAAWLWKGGIGLQANDAVVWARRMFRFSLLVLLSFCILLSVDAFLP